MRIFRGLLGAVLLLSLVGACASLTTSAYRRLSESSFSVLSENSSKQDNGYIADTSTARHAVLPERHQLMSARSVSETPARTVTLLRHVCIQTKAVAKEAPKRGVPFSDDSSARPVIACRHNDYFVFTLRRIII